MVFKDVVDSEKRRHLKWFENNKESQQKQSTLQEEHKYQKETMELQVWEILRKNGLGWIWKETRDMEILEISYLAACFK